MDFKEQLKKAQGESHDKWFERWYKKQKFEDRLLQSAKKGFCSYAITLEKCSPMSDEVAYLNRRLRDDRTIIRLKEELPDIKIVFLKIPHQNIFGGTSYTEKILFSWE
jgi:hypothetical protein